MAPPQLLPKQLSFRFDYGSQAPSGSGPPFASTLVISGLRASAKIVMPGNGAFGEAHVRIFGMSLDHMNALSTLGVRVQIVGKNVVTVAAGDATGMTQVFQGTVPSAWFEGQSAPNVPFNVLGKAGLIQNLIPVPAASFPQTVDVAAYLAQLAGQMGATFENHGVTATLSPSYFPGTAWEQLRRVCEAAYVDFTLDNGVLAAWPRDSGNRGDTGLTLTPGNGQVGYPEYTANGIMLRALYNPAIKFGGLVTVAGSILKQAYAKWQVSSLTHDLSASDPGGPWFTEVQLVEPGTIVGAPGKIS